VQTVEHQELDQMTRDVFADMERSASLTAARGAEPLALVRSAWQSLAAVGLLGVGLPQPLGGSGASMRDVAVIAESAGGTAIPGPYIGSLVGEALLAHCAAEPVLSQLGHHIATGELVVVPAWETFSHEIVPTRRDDALRLNGSHVSGALCAVPFGDQADAVLAFAHDAEAGVKRLCLLFVDAPHIERSAAPAAFDPIEPVASLSLDGAAAQVLRHVTSPFDHVRSIFAAELIGTGQRALDAVIDYAGVRRQFGRPIGSFQVIKHALADRFVDIGAARLLAQDAADCVDSANENQELQTRSALAAAQAASEAIVSQSIQFHGGLGFTWEHPAHLHLKHVRARRTLLGRPAHHLDAISRLLLAQTSTSV